MTDNLNALAIGLLGSNLAYIFVTLFFALFYSATPEQALQGPFTANLSENWLAIGAVLGAADVAAFVAFAASLFSDGR